MALKILENYSLEKENSFSIKSKAKYFIETYNKEDIIQALNFAFQKKMPYLIIGKGSNILLPEKFEGVVIKIKNSKLKIKKDLIEVEAGAPLNLALSAALKNSLSGLEWAIGIPGTIGGAIYGNAGAFGKSMKDIVKTVTVLEVKNKKFKIKKLKNKDCKFGYRESIFKKKKNLIILSTTLKLKKDSKNEIKKRIKEYLKIRKKTQPLNFPSAGSVFKNPEFKIKNKNLFKRYPELNEFQKKGIIPAGWLIEKCNLKGKKIGGAKISEIHGNFIVNFNKATSKDILKLINLIKRKVKKNFDIELKEELQTIDKNF
jgi:UDP-N-acetylmuramate dehydrogenase